MTEKGKPFGRMGRKTTGLLDGGWVAEVMFQEALPILSRERMGFLLVLFSHTDSLRDHSTAQNSPKSRTPCSSIIVENLLFESRQRQTIRKGRTQSYGSSEKAIARLPKLFEKQKPDFDGHSYIQKRNR